MSGKSNRSKKKQTVKLPLPLFVILVLAAVVYFAVIPAITGQPAALPQGMASAQTAQPTAKPSIAEPSAAEPAKTAGQAAAQPVAGGKPLTVYILDVGQGDSIFLVSPSGKTMLIDASESKAFDSIDAFLRAYGVESLDAVVATHPHSDHIGGMRKVINAYKIGRFYLPEVTHTTATYEKMLAALEDKDVPVSITYAGADSRIEWDDAVTVTILSPFKGEEYDDLNNWSAVLKVAYGGTSIILTGDAEAYAENIMLDKLPAELFKADVLKLGHHGSSSSTSEAFFKAVAPSYAVASLGEGNDYGHPHRETLELLDKYDTPFYRTDESGTITVIMDGKNVKITTEK